MDNWQLPDGFRLEGAPPGYDVEAAVPKDENGRFIFPVHSDWIERPCDSPVVVAVRLERQPKEAKNDYLFTSHLFVMLLAFAWVILVLSPLSYAAFVLVALSYAVRVWSCIFQVELLVLLPVRFAGRSSLPSSS